ncbi:PAS domain-containing protein [Shimia sp. R11_0]|uniref:helix-turn-helix transcriptional regulator n=1 Tax=Shimia sp. R11_0 TaxID=2821096 RepID=UPI001AD97337|nr:PAS domain-containing protein [Shimia sp. R11_0]MBO9477271.1 PAS domain-containing protein [Shimia sp. R11_0]
MSLRTLRANACATADAIGSLFGQSVEVVVHDLEAGTIAHIVNPYSRRVPGDPSNVQDVDFRAMDMVIGPYEKIHWDGSILRSISIVQRTEEGRAAYMICVNSDQSGLLSLQRAVEALLPSKAAGSDVGDVFRNDWHERLNIFVSDWCRVRDVSIERLDRSMRRALLAELDVSGALNERNAAAYVGRLLGVSRATIYNDLKAGASDV